MEISLRDTYNNVPIVDNAAITTENQFLLHSFKKIYHMRINLESSKQILNLKST